MTETTPTYRITSLGITRAASFWYPTMLAQESGELSESRAAELLGLSLLDYRRVKSDAIQAVRQFIENLSSPLVSLLQVVRERPEMLNGPHRELTELDVSALLAAAMLEQSQRFVVERTHISLQWLLDMIEGKREFNRRVLRFLGVRREIHYYRQEIAE